MAKRRKNIITTNREIYEKFNMLHLSPEVILKQVKPGQVQRILRNINKHGNVLDMEIVGDYVVVKRKNPFNCNIYLK